MQEATKLPFNAQCKPRRKGTDQFTTDMSKPDGQPQVIGIACRFPESDSAAEWWENLAGGVDMMTADDRRWPCGIYGTPKRMAKLKDYSSFDNAFFAVHGKQAEVNRTKLRSSSIDA